MTGHTVQETRGLGRAVKGTRRAISALGRGENIEYGVTTYAYAPSADGALRLGLQVAADQLKERRLGRSTLCPLRLELGQVDAASQRDAPAGARWVAIVQSGPVVAPPREDDETFG